MLHINVAQQVIEQTVLVRHVIGKVQTLLDVFMLGGLTGDINTRRVFQHALRKTCNIVVDRCREQQRLTCRGCLLDDGFEIVLETHIEHAVGFVEHQHFQARQIDAARLHLVEQTARRCHQDIGAGLQQAVLNRVGHATHN